jgi:anti-anti-sigma regulatory factor
VVIDLQHVEMISLPGIEQILKLQWWLADAGRTLSLANVRQLVQHTIANISLSDILCISAELQFSHDTV